MRGAQLDAVFEGLRTSEDAVAKALNISEVGQIARAELRFRQYMLAQWNVLAAKAVTRASSMAKQGKSAPSIAKAVRKIMQGWPNRVVPRMNEEVDRIYRLARTAGWKKATKQTKAPLTYDSPMLTELAVEKALPGFSAHPSFDVIDDEAIAALQGQQVLWIGEHYDTNLAAGIQQTTRETMLEAGRNRAVAGKLMQERLSEQLAHVRTPGGFFGSAEQYYEGLVANAATVARAHGQLSSFMRVGATRYTIVNPRDRRTCPVCAHMDGKTFTVQQGGDQMFAELGATSPEQIKEIHPWHSKKELKEISSKPGKGTAKDSADLSKAGFALPPFHFLCRCAVDIDSDEGVIAAPIDPPTPTTPAKVATPAIADPALRHLSLGTVTKSKRIGIGEFGAEKATLEFEGKNRTAIMKFGEEELKTVRSGIEKGTMYRREAAAFQLDVELGGQTIVPRTVVRDPGLGLGEASLQDFVTGAKTTPQIEKALGFDIVGNVAQAGNASARRMVMLDIIMANDDRHHMNVMFQAVKRKGKPASLKFIAIDNGLTFPDKSMGRFLFPDGEPFGFFADSALALDKASVKQLAKLKMRKIADILVEAKVPEKAIRATMIRVKAMQRNPKVVQQMQVRPNQELPSEHKVIHFVDLSLTKPAELIDAKAFKEITTELKASLKAAGATP